MSEIRMLKKIAEFFVIGFVMFALSLGLERFNLFADSQVVAVEQASGLVDSVSEDEAVLLGVAYQHNWHNSDPVVFQHLVKNMRLLKDSGEFSDHELFEMASTIGLLKPASTISR